MKEREDMKIKNLLSNKILNKHDESNLSNFFYNHKNPILYINHNNNRSVQIICYNNSFKNHFKIKKGSTLTFSNFINSFSFTTEPVNILGSEEILKALYKKNGKIYQFINHISDNEYVFLEINPLLGNEGSLKGIQNKNKEYYELVNLLPEIIFELNKNYTFSFLNEAALNVFDLTTDDLAKGIHVKEIIPQRDYPRFKNYLDSVFEGKIPREKNIKIIDKNNKIALVELYFTTIRQGVKVTGIRGIAINITHRKKIEEKLLQAKSRVEETDKLKTAFLMNMSHEIRTPLNSVLGYTQLLMRRIHDPELNLYLQNIKASGKGLLQLFNDLLDLSKIYAGKLDVLKSEINLNKTIDKLTSDYQTEIDLKRKDIILRSYKACKEKDIYVLLDEERLNQIFTSLFNNSLKFTDSGLIEFGYQLVGDNIHFFIRDTGQGMDDDIKKEVFEFFYKPDDSLVSKNRGTGIGLAITKGIVERMNGKIWMESEPGKGTLFNFTLPYIPVKRKSEKETDESKLLVSLKDKTILIVEDDKDNRYILNCFLEPTKARILHAENGDQALNIYSKEKIDIIFMDINIPKIDGCEVTKQIRASNKNVIILAQSAYVQKEDKMSCYAAGCDAFIEKPINGETLLEILSGFLSKK